MHISQNAPKSFEEKARNKIALFSSTSPSYLILQSLDGVNPYLCDGFAADLAACRDKVRALKDTLTARGYTLAGDEPTKVTVATKAYGYRGDAVAEYLEQSGLICEFADPDYIVMMFSVGNADEDYTRVAQSLCALSRKDALTDTTPVMGKPHTAMSLREALFAPAETLPVADCIGRVLASPTVGCPPAVPVLVGGEVVDEDAAAVFDYYGYPTLRVTKA